MKHILYKSQDNSYALVDSLVDDVSMKNNDNNCLRNPLIVYTDLSRNSTLSDCNCTFEDLRSGSNPDGRLVNPIVPQLRYLMIQ